MGKKGKRVVDFRLRTCAYRQKPSQDRISLLPNEIVICILSSLTLKEACRTSVLSKRWINVWTNISRLDFDASALSDMWTNMLDFDASLLSAPASTAEHQRILLRKRREYVAKCRPEYVAKCVNKVLSSHQALVLDEFRVSCDFNDSIQEDIDMWLQYAFARKVARLELNLREEHYAFPCEKNLIVDFMSLKSLSLIRVNVSGEVLKFFLQNCKFLERLVVHKSEDLSNLKVSGPSLALQHLEICRCYKLRSLTVCNSNIISLRISDPQILVLEDVPMLVDVQIDCVFFCDKDAIAGFPWCLSKLNALTLSLGAEQVRQLKAFAELPQLTELKQLTVIVDAPKDRSVLGLTSLIRASPNLEKFIMKARWSSICRSSRKFERAAHFPLKHLKVVEIFGYSGRRSDAELVKYLLENAVSLERIVVDCNRQWYVDCLWFSKKYKKEAERYAKQQLERLIFPRSDVGLTIL